MVDAEENPQLMIYGLGVLAIGEMLYSIDTVRMTIYQPRLEHISTWEISAQKLKQWGDEVLRPRGAMALNGEGDFCPGEWCRFCTARNTCRARAQSYLKLAEMEFRDPPLLTDDEIAEVLKVADDLAKWAADVYAFAQDTAVTYGKHWPGYKLVEGRSNRRYSDEDAVIAAATDAGYTDIFKKSLIGITEMEKLMGKQRFAEVIGPLVYKPQGKITLVPESDKREAINVLPLKRILWRNTIMKNNQTKVIIPCRFSYLHCWEPVAINNPEPKYSVSAIIPKVIPRPWKRSRRLSNRPKRRAWPRGR